MCAFQGTFAVDIWSIKCCVVDIWSIFGVFFWWSIFDKTPVAGLYWSCLGNWWGQSCEEEGKQCSSADSWGCFFNFSPNLCWDLNWNLWICHVAHVPPHDTVFFSWKWRRCPRLSSALTTRLIKYPDHHYPLWKASDDEVALIVLKRPPVTEKKIEEIEVFALSNVRRQ